MVFNNTAANIKLAGTLTLPIDKKVKAVAILISGSGPQDRDGSLFNHKPFWVIADFLSRRGYAVLRIDDRGVGQSEKGDSLLDTSEDFVTDISAAVDFLKQRSDLPTEKIGLIGHSEGGMIAPMLMSNREDIAFGIFLAGPGMPISNLFAEQLYLLGKATALYSPDYLNAKRIRDQELFAEIAKLPIEQKFTQEIINKKQINLIADEIHTKPAQDIHMTRFKQFETGWFRFFLSYDPADYFKNITTSPILALYGSTDLQVAAESNSENLGIILKRNAHLDFEIVTLKEHNHLFQKSKTGSPSEYESIKESFSYQALNVMTKWLDRRFN